MCSYDAKIHATPILLIKYTVEKQVYPFMDKTLHLNVNEINHWNRKVINLENLKWKIQIVQQWICDVHPKHT